MASKPVGGKKAQATAPVKLPRNIKGQSKSGHGNKGMYK